MLLLSCSGGRHASKTKGVGPDGMPGLHLRGAIRERIGQGCNPRSCNPLAGQVRLQNFFDGREAILDPGMRGSFQGRDALIERA